MQWTAWRMAARTAGGWSRSFAMRSARGTPVPDGCTDGSADGQADCRAVARVDAGADARRDGRLRPVCDRVGGWPPRKHSRPPGGRLCQRPGGRPADGEADGQAHFHRSERPFTTPRP